PRPRGPASVARRGCARSPTLRGDGKLSEPRATARPAWHGGGGRVRRALGLQGIGAGPAGGRMPRTRPRPLSRYRHGLQVVPDLQVPRALGQSRPLEESVLTWIGERLAHRGYPRPLCKRLALLVTGLGAGEDGPLSGVSGTVHGLASTSAKEESVARRV